MVFPKSGYILNHLTPNVYQFYTVGPGCHVYLIVGDELNVLIDTGIITKFNSLNYLLVTEIGLKLEEINLVINTHEHFDHISSNAYFHCITAAHRWAAVKIQYSDELITKGKKWGVDLTDLTVNIWLEDRNIIDLGNTILKVIETPGHTSGCICLYEPFKHYSISEYINSLQILNTLKIDSFYPGHGNYIIGEELVKKEIESSITNAKIELETFTNRIKTRPLEKVKIPPSLYNRKEEDL